MSSSDGPDGTKFPSFQPAPDGRERGVDSLLLETLIHVLIEKGVLTKNDALSVISTAAQVTRGQDGDDGAASVQADAAVNLLRRMYVSFEALDDAPAIANFDGQNVHRLRPPVHGDRPRFPDDE